MLHSRQIKEIADNTKHCGDYGQFYLHKYEKKIGIVAGDSDEIETDDFEKLGYEVTIEAECNEWEDNPNYVLFSLGTEYNEDDSYIQKLSLNKRDRLAAEALFTDPFDDWIKAIGKEGMLDEVETEWARTVFNAGRQSCQ